MIEIETKGFNPEKQDVQEYLCEVRRRLAPLEKDIITEDGGLTLEKEYPDKTGIRTHGFSNQLEQRIRRALQGF